MLSATVGVLPQSTHLKNFLPLRGDEFMQVANIPHPTLDIDVVVSELFGENAYLLRKKGAPECVIVDPGGDVDAILATIELKKLQPKWLFNTHGHADHIAGNAGTLEKFPDLPLLIGRIDANKLTDPVENLSAAFGFAVTSPPADVLLEDDQICDWLGFSWEIRLTPGHCAGHVIAVAKEVSPVVVIGGDLVFQGSVGRSDFPDSDPEALENSIRQRLYDLPGDTLVLPGHGPTTTVEFEKAHNPFVHERSPR
jgi:hydroxyacylglutathione hydrolase